MKKKNVCLCCGWEVELEEDVMCSYCKEECKLWHKERSLEI